MGLASSDSSALQEIVAVLAQRQYGTQMPGHELGCGVESMQAFL